METQLDERITLGRRSFSRLGLGLLIAVITFYVLHIGIGMGINVAVSRGADRDDLVWLLWLSTFLPIYLVGMPLGLLIMRKAPAPAQPEQQQFGGKQFWLYALMCMPLFYGGNFVGGLLSALLSGGRATNNMVTLAMDPSLFKVIFMVILGPICEEFIFRKQLIDRSAQYGERTAVLFSALMFALFHMNLYQFFYAFGLGWLFGYIYLRTRKLRYSTLLHIMVNFIGSVLSPLILIIAVDGVSPAQTREEEMLRAMPHMVIVGIYSLLLIGLSIAGLVMLIVYARQFTYRPAELELPKECRFKTVYCNPGVIVYMLVCLVFCTLALFT